MFGDVAALRSEILRLEPRDFVSHYIFEPVPFVFRGDLRLWIDWKTSLAHSLNVDPYDIVLTGSAAVGFSLNPRKGFKQFDALSDVDVGVISQYHFEVGWRFLRQLRPSWLSLPRESKRAIRLHRANYVFAGTIATDSMLGLLPFGAAWQSGLDEMAGLPPTTGRDVRLRIYKDYESLRHYQAKNIEQLRDEFHVPPTEEVTVATEE